MPLYKINAIGPTHRRRENGKMIVYANRGREGERGEIELTPDQAQSDKYRHLLLTLAGVTEIKTSSGGEGDGGKGGSQSGDADPADGLDGLTKKQLQELASANGIEFETDANKATLIEKLRVAGVTAPKQD